MEKDRKLKLFISYSHRDEEPYVEEFKKHIAPLKENGLIEEWYDRKILPGEDYQSKIDNNLENADIICLFISANFLSSESCRQEKEKALELRKKKGISVIPIILSPCGWLDDKDICKLLALPTDGKPILSFQNRDEAWYNIYNGLKKIIEKGIKIKQLRIRKEFELFLQDTEMFMKAHSHKERVFIDDIFVYPELDKYDDLKEYEKKMSSEELLKNITDYPKIVIAGEGQSGKTTLCKMIFKELRKKNFVPVYISDKENKFRGKIENKILKSLNEQYENVDINEIDKGNIVPILDDFHFAVNKEKILKDLTVYPRCIVIVDEIFSLNIKDEKLIGSFSYFRIRELSPSLRYELIKNWVTLTDKSNDVEIYKDIDEKIELTNAILGKTISKGILPSYPFFILSAIVTYETFAMPLNQEITSQGYCYQALIYFYLRKQGVKNDEIDIYINFLTELSFYFYKAKKNELSPEDFTSFMRSYLEKYNLPIREEILLKNLSQIILVDNLNNYSFHYPYLYYYFVAKYLVEHIEDKEIKREIEKIINNLHIDENAYIAVFMTHHSKSVDILDEIEANALILFDKYKPATLTRDEVKFFDEQVNTIVKAALPPATIMPEKERAERLKMQDEIEQSPKDMEEKEKSEEYDPLEKELRRAIRTVEVMGCIIKNRAGSLEKTKIEEIFNEGVNVYLRILSGFFNYIKSEDGQKSVIDFLSKRLEKIIKEREEGKRKLSEEKLKEISRIIFWNINFFVVYGVIQKIIHSLGSNKLIEIIKKSCDEINTPASFLVKHGILMWYNKNLQIDELANGINKKDFSEIAKRTLQLMVVNHCVLHPINYRDRQRIEAKLGIPAVKLPRLAKKNYK
ncbi:ATPase [Candidatus Kryptonium thompsonii]|uniref:ATPase n=1 Tax=Candidatus Kryptonium thompsonii TaxID=1633631 RepID=A0A0S4NFD2_9BACT|nr:ATPase [Candidatus Kryptonium thompsoni]